MEYQSWFDFDSPDSHLSKRETVWPAGFQFYYVSSTGQIHKHTKPTTGYWLEIVGSPDVDEHTLYVVSKVYTNGPVKLNFRMRKFL